MNTTVMAIHNVFWFLMIFSASQRENEYKKPPIIANCMYYVSLVFLLHNGVWNIFEWIIYLSSGPSTPTEQLFTLEHNYDAITLISALCMLAYYRTDAKMKKMDIMNKENFAKLFK